MARGGTSEWGLKGKRPNSGQNRRCPTRLQTRLVRREHDHQGLHRPPQPRNLRSTSLPERCRGSAQSVRSPSPGPHRPADTEPGRHCAPQRAPPGNGWAVTGCGRSREPPLPLPGRPVLADRKEPAEPSWAGWVAVGACPSGATEGLAPKGSHSRMRGWLPGCTPGTWAHMCAHKPI